MLIIHPYCEVVGKMCIFSGSELVFKFYIDDIVMIIGLDVCVFLL